MTLIQLLQSGGVLRYKPAAGFFVVKGGQAIQISDSEARRAVDAQQVVPAGIAGAGIYVFKLNTKAINAVPAVRRDSPVLPQGPASVPNALPGVRALRGQVDSEDAALVQPGAGRAPGALSSGAGRLDGARPQRAAVAHAGKGGVGGGGCGVMA